MQIAAKLEENLNMTVNIHLKVNIKQNRQNFYIYTLKNRLKMIYYPKMYNLLHRAISIYYEINFVKGGSLVFSNYEFKLKPLQTQSGPA